MISFKMLSSLINSHRRTDHAPLHPYQDDAEGRDPVIGGPASGPARRPGAGACERTARAWRNPRRLGRSVPLLTQATSLAKSALSGFAWAATLVVAWVCFASRLVTSSWRDWQATVLPSPLPQASSRLARAASMAWSAVLTPSVWRSARTAAWSAETMLAIRRLLVRAKAATNTRNAHASNLPINGSDIVRSGRKNMTASASTPMAAGRIMLEIGPPVMAFQMLMLTPRAKKP